MKIVVIGGTSLIGSKAIPIVRLGGHEVLTASPKTSPTVRRLRTGRTYAASLNH